MAIWSASCAARRRGIGAQDWGAGRLLNAQDRRVDVIARNLDDFDDLSQPLLTIDRAVPLDRL